MDTQVVLSLEGLFFFLLGLIALVKGKGRICVALTAIAIVCLVLAQVL